jgi:MFS family permease
MMDAKIKTDALPLAGSQAQQLLQRNIPGSMWLRFFYVFGIVMPLIVPLFQSKGLDMQEIFALQTIFALAMLVSEVPFGYLADVFGRRNIILAGSIAAGLGHSQLLFADSFAALVIYEFTLGIGASLLSGADLALLYDTELALGKDAKRQRRVVGKLYSFGTFSAVISAALCSMVLLAGGINEVVWVQAIIGWGPLCVVYFLVEAPRPRKSSEPVAANTSHWQAFWEIVQVLLAQSTILRQILLALCIWPLTTFYATWLLQRIWQDQGVDLIHFGWLWAALTLLTALSSRFSHRIEALLGPRILLGFIGLAPIVGFIALAQFGFLLGLLGAAIFFVIRGLGTVLLTDALNRRISSDYRATANSLSSFGFRSSFALTGPMVGFGFDVWGLEVLLLALGLISAVLFLVILRPLMRSLPGRRVFRKQQKDMNSLTIKEA